VHAGGCSCEVVVASSVSLTLCPFVPCLRLTSSPRPSWHRSLLHSIAHRHLHHLPSSALHSRRQLLTAHSRVRTLRLATTATRCDDGQQDDAQRDFAGASKHRVHVLISVSIGLSMLCPCLYRVCEPRCDHGGEAEAHWLVPLNCDATAPHHPRARLVHPSSVTRVCSNSDASS
jgi:hypothetical protein